MSIHGQTKQYGKFRLSDELSENRKWLIRFSDVASDFRMRHPEIVND
jgi:hypothetical protein